LAAGVDRLPDTDASPISLCALGLSAMARRRPSASQQRKRTSGNLVIFGTGSRVRDGPEEALVFSPKLLCPR